MIHIKNKREILLMQQAGERLAQVFKQLPGMVVEGTSTFDIDQEIERLLQKNELKGECKGYGGYPAVSCISVNQVVVHGIPSKKVVLKAGDFVKIDVVGSFKGYCADMARGYIVAPGNEAAEKLNKVAQEAFMAGFALIKPGVRLFTISHAIESYVKQHEFGIVREFAGHGIGKKMHEEPEIPNFGEPNTGPVLRSGMVLAIEPMITENVCKTVIDQDRWTARTSDGCLAAHFENTVLVTDDGAKILTE